MLGLSALGVAAFTFFPQYVNAVFGERSALVSTSASREVKLRVVGMTCTGCETGIETALRRLPGVAFADASYDDGTVVVHLAPGATLDAEALVKTIATAGYEARPIETGHPAEPAREQSLRVLQHDLAPLAERFNTVSGRTQFLAILSPT